MVRIDLHPASGQTKAALRPGDITVVELRPLGEHAPEESVSGCKRGIASDGRFQHGYRQIIGVPVELP